MSIYVFLVVGLIAAGVLNHCTVVASDSTTSPNPKVIPIKTKTPESNKVYPIAVVGAGAGGIMAAKRAVLNNDEVILFSGAQQEQRRSRGNWVRTVDNVPGLEKYKRTILEVRNDELVNMVQSPLSHNLYLVEDSIVSIEKTGDHFRLKDGSSRIYYAKYVILATGIMDEQPHIQGTIKPILKYANGQTVVYCLICDGHRSYGKKTVVIGYSEAAASTALQIAAKYHPVSITMVTNGHPNEWSVQTLEQMRQNHIRIVEAPIQEVLGNEELKQLKGFQLTTGQVVEADIAFVALGIRPNNQLALQLGAKVDERGLVLTDPIGESSVPNLFVVGDLKANSMKQIYTAWQHAVESVQLINKRIRNEARAQEIKTSF